MCTPNPPPTPQVAPNYTFTEEWPGLNGPPVRRSVRRHQPRSLPHGVLRVDLFRADLLRSFRYDLIATNSSIPLLSRKYLPDHKASLVNIINRYFNHLKFQLNIKHRTYLDLLDPTFYPFDDLLAYGKRFTDFLSHTAGRLFLSKVVQTFLETAHLYRELHPPYIHTLRAKLLELQAKPAGTTGTAGNLEIDYSMITYEALDESSLHASLRLLPDVTSQLEAYIAAISLTEESRASLCRLVAAINSALQASPLACLRPKLHQFGSLPSNLATYDSDLDIVLRFEAIGEPRGPDGLPQWALLDYETSLYALELVDRLLSEKLNLSSLWAHRRIIPSRRCPIIKYEFEHCFAHVQPPVDWTAPVPDSPAINPPKEAEIIWTAAADLKDNVIKWTESLPSSVGDDGKFKWTDPPPTTEEASQASRAAPVDEQLSGEEMVSPVGPSITPPPPKRARLYNKADLSVKSLNGVFASKLLYFLTHLEPRFQAMTLLLKTWAKRHGLITTAGINSYGLALLVIFYLQSTSPPVLPPLVSLERHTHRYMALRNADWTGADLVESHLKSLPKSTNTATLPELLVGFFTFYQRFDYYQLAITPRSGVRTYRKSLLEVRSEAERARFRMGTMVLEDPADRDNNVAAGWAKATINKWNSAVRRVALGGRGRAPLTVENVTEKLIFESVPDYEAEAREAEDALKSLAASGGKRARVEVRFTEMAPTSVAPGTAIRWTTQGQAPQPPQQQHLPPVKKFKWTERVDDDKENP